MFLSKSSIKYEYYMRKHLCDWETSVIIIISLKKIDCFIFSIEIV